MGKADMQLKKEVEDELQLGPKVNAARIGVATNVSEVLPVREAREAHELSEAGHVRGKIVLRLY